SMMRRVPEVFDCWFESGSMPFAQAHYPFENNDWFESHLPADFIVEYIAQTRGWFYTMHVLSVALFDRPAFSNVICHGVVLDHEGRKLSKKLRNYPDPEEVMESHGSDALRWHLMASPILRGGDLRISTDASDFSEVVRLVLNPIWNAYSFFSLYANADGHRARIRTDATGQLDRYILAKTAELVDAVTEDMDDFEIAPACAGILSFLDALNNWYIRRSRERFWAPGSGSDEVSLQDKQDAHDTLYTVLVTLMKVAAPLLPLLTDEMYLGLTGGREGSADSGNADSVHLQDWPDVSDWPHDRDLVAAMDRIRHVCSAALGLREDRRLRARLPLKRLTIAGDSVGDLEPMLHLVRDEVNVKEVLLTDDLDSVGTFTLKPNAKVLGPRLGKDVQTVIKASKSGDWRSNEDGTVTTAGHILSAEEFEMALQPREGTAAAALPGNEAVVELDVEVTPELAAEGMARDLVRLVQQARKDEGLDVTDRISCHVDSTTEVIEAVEAHRGWVADAVLATELTLAEGVDDNEPMSVEGHPVRITVLRAG
ncbi:MAG: class I tRNA ligase family protein, partial [Microthrixaceae bacterium]